MNKGIKEHERETENSEVSEHANEKDMFLFGNRLSLLIVTLTGRPIGSKKPSTQGFIQLTNGDSKIEIPEAWMPIQSKSSTAS